MASNDRVALMESVIDILLTRGREGAHVSFNVTPGRDKYVQFAIREGGVIGEVGSRQWIEPKRPLSADAAEHAARWIRRDRDCCGLGPVQRTAMPCLAVAGWLAPVVPR